MSTADIDTVLAVLRNRVEVTIQKLKTAKEKLLATHSILPFMDHFIEFSLMKLEIIRKLLEKREIRSIEKAIIATLAMLEVLEIEEKIAIISTLIGFTPSAQQVMVEARTPPARIEFHVKELKEAIEKIR